jgi:hypothetical protein
MSTNPPTEMIPPVDPAWALPNLPDASGCMTGPAFARLLAAARAGGLPAVYRVWAENETTSEINSNGAPRRRPAKRRTLDKFLERRTDLARLLSEACEEKRNRLLNDLETEIERIALGPGTVDRQFDKKTGALTRESFQVREKLYAILQLLKAHNRPVYGDQRSVSVDGQVQVDHRHAHAHLSVGSTESGYRVSYEDLGALPPAEQQALLTLLDKVEAARMERKRQENQPPALPPGESA